jgi:hypothetical protein
MFVFQPWARLNEDLFVSQRFDRIQRRGAAGGGADSGARL